MKLHYVLACLMAGCLTGCYPSVDQMNEMAQQHPTLSDVKLLQMEDQQFSKELLDAHDVNISEQHKIQTPEAASAIDQQRLAAAAQMQKILDDSLEMVRSYERSNGEPFSGKASWLEALITAMAGGGLGAGVVKLGRSRSADALSDLRVALATKAGPGDSM